MVKPRKPRPLKTAEYVGLVLAIIALALFFIPSSADVFKRWGLNVVIAWLILTLGAALVERLSERSWKRTGLVTLAVGVITGVLLIEMSQSETNKSNEPSDNSKFEALNNRLDEITRLLREQSPEVSPANLLAKYPGGYVIFEATYQSRVFPYENHLAKEWTIDWSSVRLRVLGDRMDVRLPDMSKHGTVLVHDNWVGLRRVKGAIGSGLDMDEISPYVEVLAVTSASAVFVVGLRPPPPDITDSP